MQIDSVFSFLEYQVSYNMGYGEDNESIYHSINAAFVGFQYLILGQGVGAGLSCSWNSRAVSDSGVTSGGTPGTYMVELVSNM